MYLLDTNTVIYFFKDLGGVAQRLLSLPPSDIAIPTIVLFELEVGIAKSNSPGSRAKQLRALSDAVKIISFGRKEAVVAARIRAELERQGATIGPFDTLIAGTALANGATLVTHNTKEFGRIDKLLLEDWF